MKLSIFRKIKLIATTKLPFLSALGPGHSIFYRCSASNIQLFNDKVLRGEVSKIILTGKHSYGLYGIEVKSWGEGTHLFVGSFCSLGGGLKVYLGGNHRTDWITSFPFGYIHNEIFPSGLYHTAEHPLSNGHVTIDNDVWIGESVTIMSGVRIYSGSVVAANSVVTRDVEPYTIVGGNPAKLIRARFSADTIEQLLSLSWWSYPDQTIDLIVPLLQQIPTPTLLTQIKQILAGKASHAQGNLIR